MRYCNLPIFAAADPDFAPSAPRKPEHRTSETNVRYQLNSPDVIHETVDGEALVIHTPSGCYYSLEGTGEQVWNALLAGHTPDEIAASYAGDTEGGVVLDAVKDFADQLEQEQLLVQSSTQAPRALPSADQPFCTPTLTKFTDMQELLLVDPIHEVDPQAGWPKRLAD